ncbi:M23 family metallopeptidase [Phytoactinopolyspora limicola]|uniref:M23 family metallopeptidase n=1 Tax=Phytoactinopolyspora limicola TaxID=2715536 RepID=UPI00140BA9C1|nr:M23 family metallopeptidase [Phytoactinopolyspora limicola]
MFKKALIVLTALLLLSPSTGLLAVAVLMNPGGQAAGAGCLDLPVENDQELNEDAPIPDEARPWIATAAATCPALPSVWIAAVMHHESSFIPDAYADDVNGGTWGLFQINRHVWHTVYGEWEADRNGNGIWDIKEPLIHAEYGAVYLCDLRDDIRGTRQANPDWASTRELTELEALAVAHNAGPGRLATYPDIPAITREYLDTIRHLTRDWSTNEPNLTGATIRTADIPEADQVVLPLPDGTYTFTSGYGLRPDPTDPTKEELHTGIDLAAEDGTPIHAVADGVVAEAHMAGGATGTIIIEHRFGDHITATVYMHMWEHGIHVEPGDIVTVGEHIGDVGASGRATGPHLHVEVRNGGATAPPSDPVTWFRAHGAGDLGRPDNPSTEQPDECAPSTPLPDGDLPPPPQPFTGSPGGRVDDPTGTGGWVTRQLAHLIAETRSAFPNTGWSCWAERPGTDSDHPHGRACDVTFGNAIGEHPTDTQRAEGWRTTTWLQLHADALWVDYLIWDGLIWSVNRTDEGWRSYDGGGMHDPDDVTGGHYDHLHLSVSHNSQ